MPEIPPFSKNECETEPNTKNTVPNAVKKLKDNKPILYRCHRLMPRLGIAKNMVLMIDPANKKINRRQVVLIYQEKTQSLHLKKIARVHHHNVFFEHDFENMEEGPFPINSIVGISRIQRYFGHSRPWYQRFVDYVGNLFAPEQG